MVRFAGEIQDDCRYMYIEMSSYTALSSGIIATITKFTIMNDKN